MQVEERRLDEMMEAERQNALRVQEEIERRRREESYLRALQILDQIKENEKERSVLDLPLLFYLLYFLWP